MKATGIVRRIDDLGRVVIPKEIRRTLRIREGDPMEIFTDTDGEVIFKKYSPLGNLDYFASDYAEVLFRSSGYPVIVTDTDKVIAVAGIPKNILEQNISDDLAALIKEKKDYRLSLGKSDILPVEDSAHHALAGAVVVCDGDAYGSVLMLCDGTDQVPGEVEIKLLAAASAFLGKQMEI